LWHHKRSGSFARMQQTRRTPVAVLLLGLVLMPWSTAHAQGNPPGQNQGASSLLSRYPLGGGALVADCRDLLLADLTSLDAILGLARTATTDQRNALGTCLGLAALELAKTNQQASNTLQNAVVSLGDQVVLAAYIAVTGNEQLAAAGPGSGGGAETSTVPSTVSGGIAGPSVLAPSFGTRNFADVFILPVFTTSGPGTPPGTPSGPTSPIHP
jgi:hypothetical protein